MKSKIKLMSCSCKATQGLFDSGSFLNHDTRMSTGKRMTASPLTGLSKVPGREWNRRIDLFLGTIFLLLIGFISNPLRAEPLDLFKDSVNTERPIHSESNAEFEMDAISREITEYPILMNYIQMAVEMNPELKSMRALVDAESERMREAGLLMDPEINVGYDFNPMMSDSFLGRFSISAMQMFPWFSTLEARRELSRSSVTSSEASLSVRQIEIVRDLQLTWFSIAELQSQIRITEETIGLIRELETVVMSRYESGRSAQGDLLRIEMEEQRMMSRLENLKDQMNPLKARFNGLMNRDLSAEIETSELMPQAIPFSDDDLRSKILEYHPEFDLIQSERKRATEQIRLAELDGRPGFGLGIEIMGRDFGAMSMFPDARESIVGMATLRVPIYRSRYDSRRQQAVHTLRSLDYRQVQSENRLLTEMEELSETIRSSERTLHLIEQELIPRTRQILSITREDYSAGSLRFDELLQLQRDLLGLELERIETIALQNRSVALLRTLYSGN